jgi:peptidoglycan/xylan/chitin deacetylase (PgdA/CDA1 family)
MMQHEKNINIADNVGKNPTGIGHTSDDSLDTQPTSTAGLKENIRGKYSRVDNFQYPKGFRLAANFTVDFDAMLNRRLKNEPFMELTQGEFGGRVGIWRLMDLFDTYDIKLTIFTVGRICELYPEALKEAVKRGHEVANHTWEHRIPSDIELEKDHLLKATEAIEKLCGKKPVGTRSGHRLSLLKNEEYIYTSGNVADDIPYYVFDDEGQNCMLNLPFHHVLDDAMYFHFGWLGSGNAGQRLADPSKVYDVWSSAFRELYKTGRYMNICLHPFVSGRSLRIAMLERLIVEMKHRPGVWFPTCEELARYCLERFPPPAKVK